MTNRSLSIAIIGSRGIPGNYGGFETCAHHLSTLLVKRGHDVTVYGASTYSTVDDKFYRGVKRIILPSFKGKAMEKLSYVFLSLVHASFTKNRIILLLGLPGVMFTPIPRLFGKKIAVNVDGLEWQRVKWGKLGSFYFRKSAYLAGWLCHELVTDSKVLKRYYLDRYSRKSTYIAYGSDIITSNSGEASERYGLKKGKYILQVCRLEPENNSHIVIREFEKVKTELNLVILGDAPYSNDYIRSLKKTKDPRITFLGAIYGDAYDEIRRNSFCYIHAHQVGGTNPALLEAMGSGLCVFALDVSYNREVISDAGILFSKEEGDLSKKLQKVLDDPETVEELGTKAIERIKKCYTWDKITNDYEEMFRKMINK